MTEKECINMKRLKGVIALAAAVVMALSLCSPAAFGADKRAETNRAENSRTEISKAETDRTETGGSEAEPSAPEVAVLQEETEQSTDVEAEVRGAEPSFDADVRLQELRGETATDEELIKGTVSLLFDVKCDQLTGTGKEPFDYSNFWAPEADKKDGLQYFEDCIALRKGLLAKKDAYFYDTEEILTFQDVSVSGDRASVSFYECFCYMDSRIPYNDIITDSGEGLDYRFELVKQEGVWYITAIDFDDWTTEPLKNGEMTVEELLGFPDDVVQPAEFLGGDPNCDCPG